MEISTEVKAYTLDYVFKLSTYRPAPGDFATKVKQKVHQ